MIAKLNLSGTSVYKNRLWSRADLYPEPHDKLFPLHYVDILDSKLLPTGKKKLNPCLCFFFSLPEIFNNNDLLYYLVNLFEPSAIATLDNILVRPDSCDLISAFFHYKPVFNKERIKTRKLIDLISSTKEKLSAISDIPLLSNNDISKIVKESIQIGAPAIDRDSSITSYTLVDKQNPANGTGTIDTWKIWAFVELSDCEVATFYVVSGNNLSTRDYVTLGTVASGSAQTFNGLSTDVEIGDYPGIYYSSGNIEADPTGGAGLWYVVLTDLIPCENQEFNWIDGNIISLQGTGTAAAGGRRGWWSK